MLGEECLLYKCKDNCVVQLKEQDPENQATSVSTATQPYEPLGVGVNGV